MLDDGLNRPIWTQAHYHQPNWVPREEKPEQSPSLFFGQHTESRFCLFIMGSHRRKTPQCVKNLCETDETGSEYFTLWYQVFIRYIDLKIHLIEQNKTYRGCMHSLYNVECRVVEKVLQAVCTLLTHGIKKNRGLNETD